MRYGPFWLRHASHIFPPTSASLNNWQPGQTCSILHQYDFFFSPVTGIRRTLSIEQARLCSCSDSLIPVEGRRTTAIQSFRTKMFSALQRVFHGDVAYASRTPTSAELSLLLGGVRPDNIPSNRTSACDSLDRFISSASRDASDPTRSSVDTIQVACSSNAHHAFVSENSRGVSTAESWLHFDQTLTQSICTSSDTPHSRDGQPDPYLGGVCPLSSGISGG